MDVIEKINSLGFKLDSYTNGKHDCTCPFCSQTRKPVHRKQRCAAVWIEDDFITYNCVHCGEHGFLHSDIERRAPIYSRPVIVKPKEDHLELAEDFLSNRGIRVETARKLGVYVETERFKEPMLAFPFFKGGKIVNVKYRGLTEKRFSQEQNPEPVVYNYDNVFGSEDVIVVEGEMDVLAFAEVGITNVVSIPSGSIGQAVKKDYIGNKFDFLKVSAPLFDIAKRIYLALDSDEPGRLMTNAVIDRLDKEKIYQVDWKVYPVQGKDANDFLQIDRRILPDAIKIAKPIPLRGIVNAGQDMEEFEDYLLRGNKDAVSSGFPNLDKLIMFEQGNFITVTGFPGCLHGDTIIRINRENHGKSVKIKDLYNRFNGYDARYKWSDAPTYVRRAVDGKIGLYPIKNVWYSGYKQLFQLELDDGKTLKATAEHKILTDKGYIPLKDLKCGDMVAVDNVKRYGKEGHRHGVNYKEITVGHLHPYAKYHRVVTKGKPYESWRIPAHRFIYEAYLNNMSVEELKARTKVDVTGLKFIEPKIYEIHHKDGNPRNNDISNLAMLTSREHRIAHNVIERFGQGIIEYSAVKKVTELGYDDVYDIECVDIPNNEPNFNANGIVVHNSGKSLFATSLIMNLAQRYGMKALYCAFENTPNQLKKKWGQILTGHQVINADESTIEELRKHYKFMEDHFFILQDYTTTLSVDELLDMAEQAIRRNGIKVMIIDPLNKLTYSKSNNLTEDIGLMLSKMITFAKRNNIILFLVAHPTKPSDGSRKLGSQTTPNGFDISGSANFLNMSDVILTVHRLQDETGRKSSGVKVLISKVRDTDFGHEGSCYFSYDVESGRYFPSTESEFESSLAIEQKDLAF